MAHRWEGLLTASAAAACYKTKLGQAAALVAALAVLPEAEAEMPPPPSRSHLPTAWIWA